MKSNRLGLSLPTYLVKEMDELTSDYDINRSTFIAEAIQSFIKEQKEKIFYGGLEQAVKEMKMMMMDGKLPKTTLTDLIIELKNENQ
ncbi:conserved hypothetical protein [Isorropodon fossajaponicum endosymbiont JTNG4]|nr:conserved hypothetical protein [Isorropodon fossajaponicum endosymbiont JTNG4]